VGSGTKRLKCQLEYGTIKSPYVVAFLEKNKQKVQTLRLEPRRFVVGD